MSAGYNTVTAPLYTVSGSDVPDVLATTEPAGPAPVSAMAVVPVLIAVQFRLR